MAKQDKPARGEIIPAPATVGERVRALVSANPDALSYDPSLAENELLHVRMMTDPGIDAGRRGGWRGFVYGWAVGTWTVMDQDTGEVVELPSLVLIGSEGALIRLTGWPAINCWSQILRYCPPDRVRAGLPVVITRRASGTAGRSYWSIQVDNAATNGGV